MKVAIRGYVGFDLIFEEIIEGEDEAAVEDLVCEAMKRMLPYPKHMIEVENLDDPTDPDRFARFGPLRAWSSRI